MKRSGRRTAEFFKNIKSRRWVSRASGFLALFVAMATLLNLIMPAVAMTKQNSGSAYIAEEERSGHVSGMGYDALDTAVPDEEAVVSEGSDSDGAEAGVEEGVEIVGADAGSSSDEDDDSEVDTGADTDNTEPDMNAASENENTADEPGNVIEAQELSPDGTVENGEEADTSAEDSGDDADGSDYTGDDESPDTDAGAEISDADIKSETESDAAERGSSDTDSSEEGVSEKASSEAGSSDVSPSEESPSEDGSSPAGLNSEYPAQSFNGGTENVSVIVESPAGALPFGTRMIVTAIDDDDTIDTIREAVDEPEKVTGVQAVDIKFENAQGEEIEPLLPLHVVLTAAVPETVTEEAAEPVVVHLDDEGNASEIEEVEVKEGDPAALDIPAEKTGEKDDESLEETADDQNSERAVVQEVTFETPSFSVYALVYTVDFSYVVNGKTYEFSIPGGGFITLQQLVEVLGISNGDAYNAEADGSDSAAEKHSVNRFAAYLGVEISDKTKEFVADVENVEFSDSGLVWLGKVDENSTVGALKEANGLDVQYSAELTEEQITDINAQTVESGDWALISVQPFTSEESLTVTMKNGESFTIMVTDAQISTRVITADGEGFVITVTYDESAEIPDGAELYAEEIPGDTQEFDQLFQDTEAAYEKTIKEGSVEDARFFDVKIRYGDVPIEPKAPVQVSIQYDYEIAPTEENELYIVHFAEKGTEIISDLSFEEKGTKVLYVQSGFSVIGTVTTSTVNSNNWPDAGDYVLILSTGDGSSGYYAVDQTGVLAPVEYDAVNRTVTFSNANEVSELGGYIWTHEVAGTNHRLTNNLGEPKQYMTLTDSTVMSTSTGISLAINSGYITVGRASNRYYLAMDFHNHIVVSHQAVNNGNGNISYPENPAYVTFVSTDSLRVDTHTNPYSGRQWDKEVLEEWIERLESRKPPLDELDKTAEVYDYENRIYQIDLQAKSGVDTFVNDIDLSFMLDFSNSMLFPSSLTSVNASAILTQDNLNNLVNQGVLDRNQVYVVIGDKNGTATNYAVYVYDYNSDTTSDKAGQQQTLQGFNGKWVVYDASFYAKTRAGVNGYQSIATDGRWRIPTALPTNNASNFRIDAVDGYNFVYSFYTSNETFFTGMTRSAIYSTESPGYNRLYYLKDGVKDSIRNIIQIALKDTNMTTKTVRTAYNLFWGNVGASQDFLEVTNAQGATNNYERLVRLLEQGITDGGTRQDLAMQSAGTNFSWNTSATQAGPGRGPSAPRRSATCRNGADAT